MTRNYLTACRDWQLPILLGSMLRHCRPFRLFVLAWDFEDHWIGYGERNHEGNPDVDWQVDIMTRGRFLERHPEQDHLPGPPRETINLIDTARWRLAADLLSGRGIHKHLPPEKVDALTYVDGDQFFFSSPEPVFQEIGTARMAVSPHRIPPASAGHPGATLETHRKYGLYNSGWTYFADAALVDQLARSCYWWSYSEPVQRGPDAWDFGDQGHLERIAKLSGAHVIQHPGLNVAPWNVHARAVRQAHDGQVFVDGAPLVTYHYSGLRPGQYVNPGYALTKQQMDVFYNPYLRALEASRCP